MEACFGDLEGSLDHLCLTIDHAALPRAFTDKSYVIESPSVQIVRPPPASAQPARAAPAAADVQPDVVPQSITEPTSVSSQPKAEVKKEDSYDNKAWILRYAEQGSDASESDSEDDGHFDPYLNKSTSKSAIEKSYKALQQRLEAEKSQPGDSKRKSKAIQAIVEEMRQLEKEKNFDPKLLKPTDVCRTRIR
jgi:hypothetical protein